jgi:hypothetical protein
MRFFLLASLMLLSTGPQQSEPSRSAKDASIEKRSRQQKAQQSKNSEQPDPTQIVVIGEYDKRQDEKHQEQGSTYDARQDPLYRAYLVFTILGVIGGIGGVITLICQTMLLRSTAAATQKSLEAYMDSQSGVLSVVENEFILGNDSSNSYASCRVHNIGLTAVTVFASENLLQVGRSKDVPPYAVLFDVPDEIVKSPDYCVPPDNNVPQGGSAGAKFIAMLSTVDRSTIGMANSGGKYKPIRLTGPEMDELRMEGKFLWCYGFVRYRDLFKRNFELRYCLRYYPALMPNGGFGFAGLPQFNRVARYEPKI